MLRTAARFNDRSVHSESASADYTDEPSGILSNPHSSSACQGTDSCLAESLSQACGREETRVHRD
jgi:hypothetical protein